MEINKDIMNIILGFQEEIKANIRFDSKIDRLFVVVYGYIFKYDEFPKRESRKKGHEHTSKDDEANFAYNSYRDLLLFYTGSKKEFTDKQIILLEGLVRFEDYYREKNNSYRGGLRDRIMSTNFMEYYYENLCFPPKNSELRNWFNFFEKDKKDKLESLDPRYRNQLEYLMCNTYIIRDIDMYNRIIEFCDTYGYRPRQYQIVKGKMTTDEMRESDNLCKAITRFMDKDGNLTEYARKILTKEQCLRLEQTKTYKKYKFDENFKGYIECTKYYNKVLRRTGVNTFKLERKYATWFNKYCDTSLLTENQARILVNTLLALNDFNKNLYGHYPDRYKEVLELAKKIELIDNEKRMLYQRFTKILSKKLDYKSNKK